MPKCESRIRADNEAISEAGPDIGCDVLPRIRHLPRCGRNLALELLSNFQTDAIQRHENSTKLKTLPHIYPIGMVIAIHSMCSVSALGSRS